MGSFLFVLQPSLHLFSFEKNSPSSWQNTSKPEKQGEVYTRVGQFHHLVTVNETRACQNFLVCGMSYFEYTPCQDPQRSKKFESSMLIYGESHCPTKEELLVSLIPAPPKYKNPFKWPQSRDYDWYDNIPHKELSIEKVIQNWIQVEGERFRFPRGGTGFLLGADAYIDDMNKLIPLTTGEIRTATDTGYGVASWGAYLLKRDILTMSFAPRDTHEVQVQFSLERGVPAMIGLMATQRYGTLLLLLDPLWDIR